MPRHRPDYDGPKRSIAEAVEASRPDEEVQARLVQLTDYARSIGRDRGTIRAWIDRGCPVHSQRDRTVYLDPGAVMRWREEQAFAEGEKKGAKGLTVASVAASGDGGADGESPAGDYPPMLLEILAKKMAPKELLAVEQAETVRFNRTKAAGLVSPNAAVVTMVAKLLNSIMQPIMAIPDRNFRDMAGIDEAVKLAIRKNGRDNCRSALEEGAKAAKELFRDFEWEPSE